MTNKPNLKAVQDAISGAERFELPQAAPAAPQHDTTALDPEPGDESAQGVSPGKWTPNRLGLPDDCPVVPLGVDGDTFYFLDTIGQLREVDNGKFGKIPVMSLFMGRKNYLPWAWPRYNKEGKITGFANDEAVADLMTACAAKGPWTPADRVRGRGAWLGAKEDLIYHAGTSVRLYGKTHPTGEFGRFVYPKRPVSLEPWPTAIDEEGNPAKLLLPLLRRWNWVRPEIDPVLLLGWIGAAMIGGALKWRPMVYMTGDRGTGKSTLQGIIKKLFGDGIISTANTTAAGIYQLVGQDSLPVAIDEMEGSADNRQAMRILELARQASSGGRGLRGGDRGVGSEFSIRSAFIFSSINAPPLLPQDLSRFALLRLDKIDPSLPPPTHVSEEELKLLGRELGNELLDEDLAMLGQMVLRRMIDGFPQLQGHLKAYKDELREAGHDQRGQDTFGILLACASVMVGTSFESLKLPMGENLSEWRELMKASGMSELEDATDNWRACLSYLLTSPVDAWRNGAKLTIGRVLVSLVEKEEGTTFKEVREKLEQAGVGLVRNANGLPGDWLAVPSAGPMLHKLFLGSRWQGDQNAGVWGQALRQGPRSTLWELSQVRINGDKQRCTLLSLDALYGKSGLMRDDHTNHDKPLFS
ncbi:MAG: hypothetical protein ACRCS9_13895 [Hyphomicrobium sp.]